MSLKHVLSALVFTTSVSALSTPVYADDQLDKLSEKLIQLRGEVEQLNNEIHFMKQEHKQEMTFLWTQKNEVKSELERHKKLIARLQKDLDKKIEENQAKGLSSETLKPEFMNAVADVEVYLERSIPFKKAERQASLQEIKQQVNQNLISVQRGFNKLWAFVEDEIRLSKETGLYQQSIQVSGEPQKQLVEIARVGMMNMYFKTPEDKVGLLKGQPSNWSFEILDNPEEAKQVNALFDALQKQIRTGLFPLPLNAAQ